MAENSNSTAREVVAAPALIDQMDGGMDKLRTVWLALQAVGHLDEEALGAISATLDSAIEGLKPVRDAIGAAHGNGGRLDG